MITFDGHRSMLRKPFAKKKLAHIHAIDVPSMAIKWDGFTFRVWQQGEELDGGRVTAPMGAVVIMSTWGGLFIATADHWRSGWGAARPIYTLFRDLDPGEVQHYALNTRDEEALTEAGYSTVPMEPQAAIFYYGMVDDYTLDGGTVYDLGWPSVPGIVPVGLGETFRVAFADQLYQEGATRRQVFETRIGMYYDTGRRLARSMAYGRMTGDLPAQGPSMTVQWLGPNKLAQFTYSAFPQAGDEKIVLTNITFGEDGTPTSTSLPLSSMFVPEAVTSGFMPGALRDLLLAPESSGDIQSCTPVGTHTFMVLVEQEEGPPEWQQATLLVVNATNDFLLGMEDTTAPLYQYFEANPAEEKWKLSYVMRIGSTVYMVHSDQFIGLLNSLVSSISVGAPPSVNWMNALRVMRRLSMVWPLGKNYVPYDSAMFHDASGNIVSWSREWGAVAFTTDGLFDVNDQVWLPDAVTDEDGVRPEISFAGHVGEEYTQTFLCVCRKVVEKRIRLVCWGTPFIADEWYALPLPPDGFELVQVRPARAAAAYDILLFGIVWGQKEGAEEAGYYFSSLEIKPDGDPETLEEPAAWQVHGRLPFADAESASFQLGVFGNDPAVRDMMNYPDHPPVTPQLPTSRDYSLYANGMP